MLSNVTRMLVEYTVSWIVSVLGPGTSRGNNDWVPSHETVRFRGPTTCVEGRDNVPQPVAFVTELQNDSASKPTASVAFGRLEPSEAKTIIETG